MRDKIITVISTTASLRDIVINIRLLSCHDKQYNLRGTQAQPEEPKRVRSMIEHTEDLVSRVSVMLSAATVPLFRGPAEPPTEPLHHLEFVGNSVLVKIESSTYLLTADHINDDLGKDNDFYYPSGSFYSSIPGVYVQPSSTGQEHVDFGLWVIDPAQSSEIPFHYLEFNPQAMQLPAPGGEFFVVAGYPASSFKGRSKISLTTIVALPTTDPFGRYAPEQSIVLKYDRDNQLGSPGPRLGPKPEGMSGCGVYRFAQLPRNGYIVCDLVGIFTDYHKQEDILVAQRIDTAIRLNRWDVNGTEG